MRRAMTACRNARAASLFVGDSSGSATKAITASQSLRISRARARTFCSIACSLHWQFHLMRASRRLDGLLDPSVFGIAQAPALVVSATRVRTGEARLFWDAEVSADVLLASACLPQIFPPVDIEGEPYWDGGYASNPPLRPLIEAGAPADVILVPTAPMERPEPPHGAAHIRERSAEIAFGTALRLELRSLAMAQRLLAELPEPPPPGTGLARLREARLHVISAEEALRALPSGSALDTRWDALRRLRDLGRGTAERWLDDNLAAVGTRPTLDLARFARPAVEIHVED